MDVPDEMASHSGYPTPSMELVYLPTFGEILWFSCRQIFQSHGASFLYRWITVSFWWISAAEMVISKPESWEIPGWEDQEMTSRPGKPDIFRHIWDPWNVSDIWNLQEASNSFNVFPEKTEQNQSNAAAFWVMAAWLSTCWRPLGSKFSFTCENEYSTCYVEW